MTEQSVEREERGGEDLDGGKGKKREGECFQCNNFIWESLGFYLT